jgi:hypothetical protein
VSDERVEELRSQMREADRVYQEFKSTPHDQRDWQRFAGFCSMIVPVTDELATLLSQRVDVDQPQTREEWLTALQDHRSWSDLATAAHSTARESRN